ncbi:prephenate dehydratase [Lentzea sp. NPDC058436]|uniref:prephenate dehydratase n=1 Tax=Lentzea sp. NPDC058436 TaxID=3346499 RepID=UPI003669E7A9
MTRAYLGPRGTFSEVAARTFGAPVRPYASVSVALAAVRGGECDAAVIPLENSTSGVVPSTLGELATIGDLRVDGEVEVPVRLALLGAPGASLSGITRVLSHPHAHNQCAGWVGRSLPGVEVVLSDSTAAAASAVAAGGSLAEAAIASPAAAGRYGLAVLAESIGDRSDAWTRFVSVGPAGEPTAPTGDDRTSLLITHRDNRPGLLAGSLAEFGARGVDLVWLHSWPDGASLRRFRFFVDVAGHLDDPPLADAVTALREHADVVVLGSYARAPRAAGKG